MQKAYTAKLQFHKSPTRHNDNTMTVQSPLSMAGSMVTTQLISCAITVLQAVVNSEYTITVQSLCLVGDEWNGSFAV